MSLQGVSALSNDFEVTEMNERREQFAEEQVMRDEFDQIAQHISLRIDEQLTHIQDLASAHRSTREAKRQLAALMEARKRIQGLRSRFS